MIAHNAFPLELAYYRAGVECARVHFAELRGDHPTILRVMRDGRRAAIRELDAVEEEVLGIVADVRRQIFRHHPTIEARMGEPN